MTVTQAQAQPGDVLLDPEGMAWKRGAEFFQWSNFDGLVGYEGPWSDSYGPQGECDLLVRNGQRVPA